MTMTISSWSQKRISFGALALLFALGGCTIEPPVVTRVRSESVPAPMTTPWVTLDIPQSPTWSSAPGCASNAFDLRECLVNLIAIPNNSGLIIQIAAGQYDIDGDLGGLILFQKQNITIKGTRSPKDNSLQTRINIKTADTPPDYLLRFFAEIIDSSNITFQDLDIDGGSQWFSGFGICPLGDDSDNPTQKITIEGIQAGNFYNFFTLVGQTTGHDHLHGKSTDPSMDPGLRAVYSFTGATQMDASPRQYCGGSVQDVVFSGNTLFLKSVGFYAVPLIVAETNGYGGLDAPYLISNGTNLAIPKGSKTDWYDVLYSAASQNSGFEIIDNQFLVDIDETTFLGDASCDYQCQLDNYFHSMIKFQGTYDLTIENNIIDAGGHTDVFGQGAAINVAFNNLDTLIDNNHLVFPTNYAHPDRAIVVESGFVLHPFFGSGWLTYTEQGTKQIPLLTPIGAANVGKDPLEFGIEGLAGPTLGLQITNNTFNNVFMAVDACCSNSVFSSNADMGYPVLAWGDVTDYCGDIDKNQLPGNKKADQWVVSGNTFNFDNGHRDILTGRPTAQQPAFIAGTNDAFIDENPHAPFPIEEICRQKLSWTNQDNEVCNKGVCTPSTQQ